MEKRNNITMMVFITAVIVLALMPARASSASKPIKLTMVSGLSESVLNDYQYFWLIEEVKKRSNGELIIEHKGGPEVIPGRQQFGAVRRGIVDILMAPYTAWNGKQIPKGYIINLSNAAPEGKLPANLYEWMVKNHEEVGLRFLGMARFYLPFHHFLSKKVEKLDDLKGLKIRSGGLPHIATQKKLGMVPVFLPIGEIYTAMERGVVDGFTLTPGMYRLGLPEVTKAMVFPPYKTGAGPAYGMNLRKWKQIPKNLQDVLIGVMEDLGERGFRSDKELYKKELGIWKKAGVEFITFTGRDAEKVSTTYDNFIWEEILKPVVTPDEYKMLKASIKPES